MLQFIEGMLLLLPPFKTLLILEQFSEWGSNFAVIIDEAAVVATNTQERFDIFHCFWYSPLSDGLYLLWVDAYAVSRDDVAKKFNFLLHKFTFFQLGIKLVFT